MSKSVIITGAMGNLGGAMISQFQNEGYDVIGSKSPGRESPDDGVLYYDADLTDEISTKAFFDKAFENHDNIHAAIFLVGGFGMGNIENTSGKDLLKLFSLNFITSFYCAQNTYQYFKKQGGGKMVLVGAKPALESGGSEMLAYTISKNAVVKLSEILNESGKSDNIQTSVIVPSVIDTPLNRSSMPDANFNDWVTPEAIAESVSFLLSDSGKSLRNTVLKLYSNS